MGDPADLIAEARNQVADFDFESGAIVDPELVTHLADALEAAEPIRAIFANRHLYTYEEFLGTLAPLIYSSEELDRSL